MLMDTLAEEEDDEVAAVHYEPASGLTEDMAEVLQVIFLFIFPAFFLQFLIVGVCICCC